MLNVLTTRLIINYWYLNLMFKNARCQCFFFFKDCFLLHPLCYIYMEVFTCCYLSIWDGDQKSMLALSRWISRCCVVWLFSLGFPSTFILKPPYCASGKRSERFKELKFNKARAGSSIVLSVLIFLRKDTTYLGMIWEKYMLTCVHIRTR